MPPSLLYAAHRATITALLAATYGAAGAGDGRAQAMTSGTIARVPVSFSGGHETDPRDRGRPVVLVAGAIGVPPETFRKAFSGVHPAQGRGPTGEEARQNKQALMSVLGPLGITNERLDEVSNYYRYRRERGEMWPTKAATADAIVENGKITRFVVTSGGSGYSSPPAVTVPGVAGASGRVELSFGKDFGSNGSVKAIVPANDAL